MDKDHDMKIIVLIPGLGGSKIYCDCSNNNENIFHPTTENIDNTNNGNERHHNYDHQHGIRLYPSKFLKFTNMNPHFFTCMKTKTKPLISHFYVSIYKRLIERFRDNGVEYKIFSYDWRLNPLDNCRRLRNYLHKIIEDQQKKYYNDNLWQRKRPSLILVGHSLGGLMIRILMEYFKFPIEYILKIYICGTPLIGSKNIYDYNCKLNIVRLLLHDNQIKKTDIPQPLLISRQDVIRFIQTFPQTALFLIPTFELVKLSYIPNVQLSELSVIHTVHNVLGRFDFPGEMLYTLIFNVSQKNKINYKIPEDKIYKYAWMITKHEKIKLFWNFNEEKYNMRCTRIMDNTVVPCTFLPPNCSVIFDYNYLKHCLIMNSLYLSNNIIENQ